MNIQNDTFNLYNNPHALTLLHKREILQGEETLTDLFTRVVNTLVDIEDLFNTSEDKKKKLRNKTYQAIAKQEIIFGSPILTNAGRTSTPTGACTVIPIDLRQKQEVLQKIIEPYYQSGMGSGFDLTETENPVETLKTLNAISHNLCKTCKRPPAGLALLSVEHRDILEFVELKKSANFLEWHLNLSVGITDSFMEKLTNPNTPTDQKEQVQLIFNKIVESAHYCGEPGILFVDRFEEHNPVPDFKYKSVAPCAEVAMSPGEVCQFSYINLAALLSKTDDGSLSFDFQRLVKVTRLLTRLLDNSVEISIQNAIANPEAIAEKRKIGIGVCGFADLLLKLGMPYGSKESQQLIAEILSIINYHSKTSSIKLGQSKGVFPSFTKSRYQQTEWTERFGQYPTQHITTKMWQQLAQKIATQGLRNASTTALPPTGLSSRILGVSQSIEPLFTLHDSDQSLRHEAVLALQSTTSPEKIQHIANQGYISDEKTEIPDSICKLLRTITQISAQEQLAMVGIIQRYVDESVSKTTNLPNKATPDDVKQCFIEAYRLGLKGMTIFRDNCLQERLHLTTDEHTS